MVAGCGNPSMAFSIHVRIRDKPLRFPNRQTLCILPICGFVSRDSRPRVAEAGFVSRDSRPISLPIIDPSSAYSAHPEHPGDDPTSEIIETSERSGTHGSRNIGSWAQIEMIVVQASRLPRKAGRWDACTTRGRLLGLRIHQIGPISRMNRKVNPGSHPELAASLPRSRARENPIALTPLCGRGFLSLLLTARIISSRIQSATPFQRHDFRWTGLKNVCGHGFPRFAGLPYCHAIGQVAPDAPSGPDRRSLMDDRRRAVRKLK